MPVELVFAWQLNSFISTFLTNCTLLLNFGFRKFFYDFFRNRLFYFLISWIYEDVLNSPDLWLHASKRKMDKLCISSDLVHSHHILYLIKERHSYHVIKKTLILVWKSKRHRLLWLLIQKLNGFRSTSRAFNLIGKRDNVSFAVVTEDHMNLFMLNR